MPPHDPAPRASLPPGIAYPKKPDNPRRDFRLGPLLAPLDALAKKEGTTSAVIIRRALRAYLDGRAPADLGGAIEALDRLRYDLSRVGGNLNQIAYAFNMDEGLDRDALAIVHDQLRAEFKTLAVTLKELRHELQNKNR